NRGLAALHPDHPKPGTTDGGSDFLLGLARPAAEQEADLMGLQLPEVPAWLIDRAFVRFPFTVAVWVHPVLLRGLDLAQVLPLPPLLDAFVLLCCYFSSH